MQSSEQIQSSFEALTAQYNLDDEQKLFCHYLLAPEHFQIPSEGTNLWWPHYTINHNSCLRNDQVRTLRIAAKSLHSAESYVTGDWTSRVAEDFQREQIVGRPLVVRIKVNMCQFARKEPRPPYRSDLLPPLCAPELAPVDRAIMVACLVANGMREGPWELSMGSSRMLYEIEAYKRNVVAGSLLSQDGSRRLFSNWGTAAVSQRIFSPSADLREAAVAFMQDTEIPHDLSITEQYNRAKLFMEYLIAQKRALQYASTLGAQQLVAEILNRWIQLSAWVSAHEELAEKVDEMRSMLRLSLSSIVHAIRVYEGIHERAGVPDDFVCFKEFSIEAPWDEEPSKQCKPVKHACALQRNRLVTVLALQKETFLKSVEENNSVNIIWDLRAEGWEMGSGVTGDADVFLSSEMSKRILYDGTMRASFRIPIRLPQLLPVYRARYLREYCEPTDLLVSFVESLTHDEDIAEDPEGVGELLSLLLHQDECVDYTNLYESSAWIAMTNTIGPIVNSFPDYSNENDTNGDDQLGEKLFSDQLGEHFFSGLKTIWEHLCKEEQMYDGSVLSSDPGHQAVLSSSIPNYDKRSFTVDGRRIERPQASKIYLDRDPEKKFFAKVGDRTYTLRVRGKKISIGFHGNTEKAVRAARPKEVQLSFKMVTIAWNTESQSEQEYNDADFNSVLRGEYGDEAVIWLLSNVFCGRLNVWRGSDLKCFFPEGSLCDSGYRCYTPLKESVVSSFTHLWHERSGSVYWTPFEVGKVFKMGKKSGGMIPFMEMECTTEDAEEMMQVGCVVTKCVG